MPTSLRNGSAASGHVDHGQRYDAFSHDEHALAVVPQRDGEVVEVVLELGHDDARLGRAHADAAPVRVGVEIEVGSGAGAHARIPVAAPG